MNLFINIQLQSVMPTQRFLVVLFFFGLTLSTSAQHNSADLSPIERQLRATHEFYSPITIDLFDQSRSGEIIPDIKQHVRNADFLYLKSDVIPTLHDSRPELLQLPITHADQDVLLDLYRVEIFTANYVIGTSAGESFPRQENLLFYRGIVSGDPNSIATVSILDTEVRILFSTANGNYRIHRQHQDQYVLYMDKDVYQTEPYSCGVTEEEEVDQNDRGVQQRSSQTGNCVEIYFECDHKAYLDNGSSIPNTEAWVAAIFNEVATIYENEEIPISISEIMVWTTTDPYALLTSTSSLLNEFVIQTGDNGYTGRLAHLLSTRSLGGGVAYVDVLCSASLACAVSASLSTNVIVFPNYSWNVNVVAHEMGHNFGSSHTHSCVWNGNNTQIDDCGSIYGTIQPCYDSENPILPEDGTIMSYCHLISGVGINFSLGFGEQPGNRIRSEYQNAPCNTGICSPPTCTELSLPLSFDTLVDVATNISWVAVNGADGYRISMSTVSGIGNIVDSLDVGLVTTYNPILNLEFNTIIFVHISAYNSIGDALGCADEFFTTEEDVMPECTSLNSPLNGAVNVLTSADLFWTASIGNQEGYLLTIGISPGGSEILNQFDVGNVTTYNPGAMPGNTTIYITISPYWINAGTPDCIEEHFTTGDPVYCTSKSSSANDEWVSVVSLGSFSNPSGAQVYSNFTNLIIEVSAGVSYPVSITAGYAAQAFNEYFRVWIDLNNDGIFANPGERVFQSGPSPGTVTGNILIPATAYIGITRMRVSMKYSGFGSPCQVFPFGEVEDYDINIGCNVVTNTLDQGLGSLHWAVGCVAPGDTITFGVALNGDTILLADEHIVIEHPVSIFASPLSNITIRGFTTPVVFEIGAVTTAISGLNIIGGTAMEGSAIQNTGTLTLASVRFYPHPGTTGSTLITNEGSLSFISGDNTMYSDMPY
jgi:hypothetical protein